MVEERWDCSLPHTGGELRSNTRFSKELSCHLGSEISPHSSGLAFVSIPQPGLSFGLALGPQRPLTYGPEWKPCKNNGFKGSVFLRTLDIRQWTKLENLVINVTGRIGSSSSEFVAYCLWSKAEQQPQWLAGCLHRGLVFLSHPQLIRKIVLTGGRMFSRICIFACLL